MLVVASIKADVYPLLAFSDVTCQLHDTGIQEPLIVLSHLILKTPNLEEETKRLLH